MTWWDLIEKIFTMMVVFTQFLTLIIPFILIETKKTNGRLRELEREQLFTAGRQAEHDDTNSQSKPPE